MQIFNGTGLMVHFVLQKVVKLRLSVHKFIKVIKLVCMPLFIRGTSFIRGTRLNFKKRDSIFMT